MWRGLLWAGCRHRGESHAVTNPADRRDRVGESRDATPAEIGKAFDISSAAQAGWSAEGGRGPRGASGSGVGFARKSERGFLRLAGAAKRAKRCRTPSPRCARPSISAATTRCRRAHQFAQGTRLEGPTGELNELSLHGPRGLRLHQSLEFSAGDFCRTSHCRAGGGQYRRREAGGAYAADCRALHPAAARGRDLARVRPTRALARAAVRRCCFRASCLIGGCDDGFPRRRRSPSTEPLPRATAPSCR